MDEFITLTSENIANEHLCCIIRTKKPHPGVEAKREWLARRLEEGHVFRKLNEKATVFIEYAPLESAWVPAYGNFIYIYCLWVDGACKGKGYGKKLMDYCIADAKAKCFSGVCMLGAEKQKAWLSDSAFAKKYGFTVADTSDSGYELLALSFDGSAPRFTSSAKAPSVPASGFTAYYTMQCPFIPARLELIKSFCEKRDIPLTLFHVDTLEKAKSLPCPFNNWALFYNGAFQTVNLPDEAILERILKKWNSEQPRQASLTK